MEKNIPKTAPCEWCGCIDVIKVWLRIKEDIRLWNSQIPNSKMEKHHNGKRDYLWVSLE